MPYFEIKFTPSKHLLIITINKSYKNVIWLNKLKNRIQFSTHSNLLIFIKTMNIDDDIRLTSFTINKT